MEDYDRIEVAYVFDTEPTTETYKDLFEKLLTLQNNDSESEKIEAVYWDKNLNKHTQVSKYEEVAQIVPEFQTISVKLQTGWDEISIGFSKREKTFPYYESTPYLQFSTWIYPLEDPDGDFPDEVKHRRREFAKIHAHAANILDPQWGFGRRGGLAIGKDDNINELATMVTPPLYEYNVFRRETVEAIGRECVLSTPAWYVKELDAGGVFLAVPEPPQQCSPATNACLEVADHLGISLGKTDQYH